MTCAVNLARRMIYFWSVADVCAMMRQYELVERVQRYKPDVNEALLNKAYVYAMQKHGHQKRASGDPYFSHPLEVAAILTDMHLDESTMAVALLHDTIEDTTATRQEIDELFGPDIGKLVEGLTKLKKLDLVSKKAEQAENLRKLLLAISEDVRVLLVKLADRLHNMRTLDHVPEGKRLRIAEETMEIYAPLAGRMGMQGMREELEELAFRYINPEAYRMVDRAAGRRFRAQQGRRRRDRGGAVGDLFEKHGIKAKVKSRQKKPWSVFRKMEIEGARRLEQLSDLFGFRVVVDTRGGLLPRARRHPHDLVDGSGTLQGLHLDAEAERLPLDPHDHRRPVAPARRIADPHLRDEHRRRIWRGRPCALLQGRRRTKLNGAAHSISKETNAYAWLRRTIEQLAEGDNPEDFLENTKLELFQDQVFCFTPKGMLIALPRGATPIDFAYAVHTEVGRLLRRRQDQRPHHAADDRAEERRRGRDHPLEGRRCRRPPGNRSSSPARRAPRSAAPPRTPSASNIPGSACASSSASSRARGEEPSPRKASKPVLRRLARKDVEDVLAAVGRGELASGDVLRAVLPDYKDERVTHAAADAAARRAGRTLRNAAGMLFQMPGRGAARTAREQKDGDARADPRRARRPAGALRRRGRRARRPHRRHPAAGRRHHHLSDPVAGS